MTTWTEDTGAATDWTPDPSPIVSATAWDDGATTWDGGATLWDVDRVTDWTADTAPSTTWTSV